MKTVLDSLATGTADLTTTARAFAAEIFAEAIAAEVKPEHKISPELNVILLALKGEYDNAERLWQAQDWLNQRSDTLHFSDSRAAMVAYAGKDLARFCRRGESIDLRSAFIHLSALHLPEKSHEAMWDFIRGSRDDSALSARWEAYRAARKA